MNKLREKVQDVLTEQLINLQLIPDVAIQLLQLTTDESSDIGKLSTVIEMDSALANQVLKTVNSAMFNLPHPINSVQRAVTVLGFSDIRKTAVKLSLYNELIARPTGQVFDLLFFWQHCLFVATLSRHIAVKLNYSDPEALYFAGLLHDIGTLVLEMYGKKSYSEFISKNDTNNISTVKNELIYFGVNHGQVGYIYCLDIQLPETITSLVTDSEISQIWGQSDLEFKQENAIVALANYLAGIQGIGSFAREIPQVLSQAVTEMIDIPSLELVALLDQVDIEMQTMSKFYGIQFPTINQLRSNLINSTLQLSRLGGRQQQITSTNKSGFLSSLTLPHQSLDPEIFVPQTLRAIHETFGFDRVIMLGKSNKIRSLITNHSWPLLSGNRKDKMVEINIDTITGDLLTCLRSRNAAVITNQHYQNRSILDQIEVDEFLAIPILGKDRVCAVLYADNKFSKKEIKHDLLPKISSIARELGIALNNAKSFELEKSRAEIDPLTSLSNKRMITSFLGTLFSEKEKLDRVCAGFLDIDRFKKLNDDCGHQKGDEALIIVANILRSLTRDGDFVGRYGGEEFVFVLPNCTPVEAKQYAERIRLEIEEQGIRFKNKFNDNKLTASIGIAMNKPNYTTYPDLISAADKAMYQAKKSGRNKVVSLH